jgi:hypothetical protein
MKTKSLIALVLQKQRGPIARLFFVCLVLIATTSGSAQLKQKRITALLLGEAAEGSRVTVVADSGLSDY